MEDNSIMLFISTYHLRKINLGIEKEERLECQPRGAYHKNFKLFKIKYL